MRVAGFESAKCEYAWCGNASGHKIVAALNVCVLFVVVNKVDLILFNIQLIFYWIEIFLRFCLLIISVLAFQWMHFWLFLISCPRSTQLYTLAVVLHQNYHSVEFSNYDLEPRLVDTEWRRLGEYSMASCPPSSVYSYIFRYLWKSYSHSHHDFVYCTLYKQVSGTIAVAIYDHHPALALLTFYAPSIWWLLCMAV